MKVIYETSAPYGTTECRKGDEIRLADGKSFFNGQEQSPSRFYVSKARLVATTTNNVTTLKFF